MRWVSRASNLCRSERIFRRMEPSSDGKPRKVMGYYALFYDVVDDFLHRRVPYREEHVRLAREAHERGDLVLARALEPEDGALLVFRGEEPGAVESFARRDPYVINGLVRNWYVRLWTVVVGGETIGSQPAAEFAP